MRDGDLIIPGGGVHRRDGPDPRGDRADLDLAPQGALIESWTRLGRHQVVTPELGLRTRASKLLDLHAVLGESARASRRSPRPWSRSCTAVVRGPAQGVPVAHLLAGLASSAIHKDTAYVRRSRIEPMHLAGHLARPRGRAVRAPASSSTTSAATATPSSSSAASTSAMVGAPPSDHPRFLAEPPPTTPSATATPRRALPGRRRETSWSGTPTSPTAGPRIRRRRADPPEPRHPLHPRARTTLPYVW